MKLPNGYGSVAKLTGNRRRPYMVRITTGFTDDGRQLMKILGKLSALISSHFLHYLLHTCYILYVLYMCSYRFKVYS